MLAETNVTGLIIAIGPFILSDGILCDITVFSPYTAHERLGEGLGGMGRGGWGWGDGDIYIIIDIIVGSAAIGS